MSTVEGIRFQHLAAQLTSIETKQFIYKLFDLDINIFISALFHYITQSPPDCINDIHTITNLISNIILSRKKTRKAPKPISTPSSIKFNELPSPLIGATASFLCQHDYIHLSQCCRSMFIGCNAPNQMQTLNLLNVKIPDYSNINLTLFPFLRTLRIKTYKMESLPLHPHLNFEFNELQSITLDMGRNHSINTGYINDHDIDIQKLKKHVPLNTNHITHLTLANVGGQHEAALPELLNHFETLSHLRFITCYDNKFMAVASNRIIPSVPKLRGLAVTGMASEYAIPIIHAYAPQLESLEFEQGCDDYDLSDIEFSKLEELVLWNPHYNTIAEIIMTAKNLRQILINPIPITRLLERGSRTGMYMFMTEEELKNGITNVFVTCKHLEHFAINGYSHSFVATLEGIETGILQTIGTKRDSMRILISIQFVGESFELFTDKIVSLIESIASNMERSNTSEFMLVLGRDCRVSNDNTNVSNVFKTISKNANISIKCDKMSVCITNKQCDIAGYDASWKLPFWDDWNNVFR
eukprot:281965_1